MAIANITLNTKVYTFVRDEGGVVTLAEMSGGVPTGFSTLSFSLRPPLKNEPLWRCEIVLVVPVTADAASACACPGQVLRYEKFRLLVELPNSGTTAERTDNALRMKDLLANAQIQSMLSTLVRPN